MLKLHFYQSREEQPEGIAFLKEGVDVKLNDKTRKWEIEVVHRIPFYGGQLVSLSKREKWDAIRLVDGCNVTGEFEKFMQKGSVNDLGLDEKREYVFTYLDPCYGVDMAVYGSYGRPGEFFYVGSFLQGSDYRLLNGPFAPPECDGGDPELFIGFNSAINNFVVALNHVVSRNWQVRGDGPLFKRWFEIRMNKEDAKVMYKMYEYDDKFMQTIDDIENTNYNFAVYIYRCYIARFVKRQNIQLKKNEYAFLNYCHKEYMSKRQAGETEKITVEKIINELNSLSPENLYFLVSEFRNNASPPSPSLQRKPRAADPAPKMKRLIRPSKEKDHVPA